MLAPSFRTVTPEQEHDFKRQIEAAKPDILWVALGCPQQEKWAHSHLGKIGVPIIMPIGAAFDFYAGRSPHAPHWIHVLGLRWLWRTITGGKRVFQRNCGCVPHAAVFLLKEFFMVRILKKRNKGVI